MKKSFDATSIVEAMVVLLIVVTWIVWVYWILNSSQRLAGSTWNRIEAISIARDGVESFTNIRDTNWIRYSADLLNCWNTLNYNINCLWANNSTYDIKLAPWNWYVIYKNTQNQFQLASKNNTWNFNTPAYRNRFKVMIDANWLYTQSWGTDTLPLYTREIQVDYLNASWVVVADSNQARMRVRSLVQWKDNWNVEVKSLTLETILTNWK